ncbi:MAG: response regulator [Rhodobacteraceae bacterium]|jgi:two-component system response regulator BaeR|nr:response regulator [Paracoccaceae bacterium]
MTKPRILIVEDETALSEIVRDYLLADGMDVDMLTEGTHAVGTALGMAHDLVILDLMLPGVDGLSICRELRKTSDVPIIMTTAKVEEIDRLLGLELGADDYVCKPYSPRELVARVRAVLRRRPAGATQGGGPLARLLIDTDRWRVSLDGKLLDLTPREFSLLNALAGRPGRVYSRDQLLALAFPDDTDVFDRTVDSHIRNLRRKIAAVSDWDPIRSVYGVGYAFED